MSDLFFRLMDCSDPHILESKKPLKEKPIPNDMQQLIIQRKTQETETSHAVCETSTSDNDSSDDSDINSDTNNDSTTAENPALENHYFNISLCDSEWA